MNSQLVRRTAMEELPPTCVMNESANSFHIIFDFHTVNGLSLTAGLSQDGERLHVVGQKSVGAKEDRQYLWSFHLPKNVQSGAIAIQRKNNFYLIQIPKKRSASSLSPGAHARPVFAS